MAVKTLKLATSLYVLKVCFVAIGMATIMLAIVTHLWELNLLTIFSWLEGAFGQLFIVLFSGLLGLGVLSIIKINTSTSAVVWYEIGLQAASGIATLALTFTLLGISLGIESLSKQVLTPETIGMVIQSLTKHFSTAFLTTVVGLPTSHIIRSILAVRWVSISNETHINNKVIA